MDEETTKFDHERKCVTIGRKANKLVLPGIAGEGSLSMLSSGLMKKMLKKGQAIVVHLFMMNMMTTSEEEVIDDGLQKCWLNMLIFS